MIDKIFDFLNPEQLSLWGGIKAFVFDMTHPRQFYGKAWVSFGKLRRNGFNPTKGDPDA